MNKLALVFAVNLLVSFSASAAQYVSLKSNKAFLRAGPSKDYTIKWIYKQKGEPLQLIASNDEWRKVRDYKGDVGWMHQSVVSEKIRGAVVKASSPVVLYRSASEESKKMLRVEPSVRLYIKKCEQRWCKVKVDNFVGWIQSRNLWGDVSYKR
ncbi:MAG: SH3 domain-containing protein [Rickettsiales bacterium]